MATLTCFDCDSPGDGNCSVCHGNGKIVGEEMPGAVSQRDVSEHRMDAQYARLCRETAQHIVTLSGQEDLTAVFLVGSDRLIKPIMAGFPGEFRKPVVLVEKDLARFSPVELQRHLEPYIANWEHKHESELVANLLSNQRGVVLGVDETLAKLQAGIISTLVVARGLKSSLRQCVHCGLASRSADPVCSACNSERRVALLHHVLPGLARTHKAVVDVVGGEAAEKLKESGGMGGWLRQPMHAGVP